MPLPRRHFVHTACGLGAALLLPSARACEVVTSTLTIIHPWTRASEGGASTALVGMRLQDVNETDRLIGVRTPVAVSAQIEGSGAGPGIDLLIPAGETVTLGDDGPRLRLLGLLTALHAGTEHPLTLVFEKAGPVRARLSVDYARFR